MNKKYKPNEKCADCEETMRNVTDIKTDWYGTLWYGDCFCGHMVDQGDGWEPAAFS